jgi:hypothetical protein
LEYPVSVCINTFGAVKDNLVTLKLKMAGEMCCRYLYHKYKNSDLHYNENDC